jgi:hypothetical protein
MPLLGFACKLPIYISAGCRAPSFDVVIPQCYYADSRGIASDSDVILQPESTADDPRPASGDRAVDRRRATRLAKQKQKTLDCGSRPQ